jgi:hypothetical protein
MARTQSILYVLNGHGYHFLFSLFMSLIHTRLDTATGSILDRDGTSRNVLDSLSDARPVTECDEGNVLVLTPGNKVYKMSLIRNQY